MAGSFWSLPRTWGPSIISEFFPQTPAVYGGTVLKNVHFDGFAQAKFEGENHFPVWAKTTCAAGDRNYALMADMPGVVGTTPAGNGVQESTSFMTSVPSADSSSPSKRSRSLVGPQSTRC